MLGKRCIKVLRLKYMLKEYETVLYYVEICWSSSLNSFMFTSIFHQIVVSTIVFENCAQHYYLLWESKETKWKADRKKTKTPLFSSESQTFENNGCLPARNWSNFVTGYQTQDDLVAILTFLTDFLHFDESQLIL